MQLKIRNTLLFILITVLTSCFEESPPEPIPLDKLSVESMKQFLPLSEIPGNSEAVYIDSSGVEKTLGLRYEESTKTKIHNNQEYEADRIVINYTDPQSTEYSLYIDCSGNYTEGRESILYVTGAITQFVTGYPSRITINEQGEPRTILTKYYESLDLLDKSFENVFTNSPIDDIDAYGKIYYTANLGIVGFKDRNGVLYILKEFRE